MAFEQQGTGSEHEFAAIPESGAPESNVVQANIGDSGAMAGGLESEGEQGGTTQSVVSSSDPVGAAGVVAGQQRNNKQDTEQMQQQPAYTQQRRVKQRAQSMDTAAPSAFPYTRMLSSGPLDRSPSGHTSPMNSISMGYVQEPGLLPPQFVHSTPHSPVIGRQHMHHAPYGIHGHPPPMMHGVYNDNQYGNIYPHHPLHPHHQSQQYHPGMYHRPADFGGGLGYGRGFLPMNGGHQDNGAMRGRGGLPVSAPRGRGGRQPQFSRKNLLQDKLSSNKDRTVYVNEIDHSVTEADLAVMFSGCGEVVDCRLCGDAHSRMRFAFVEFSQDSGEEAIAKALQLNNQVLGSYPIRVLRSKTAIVPVKRELMPQSEDEMQRCQKTIYVSNIDKRLTQDDVINFFEAICQGEGDSGKVSKIRLLADNNHSTAIAFVEFVTPESASIALANCQGALMGCLPLRVFPSKTPVRTQEEDRLAKETRKAAVAATAAATTNASENM
eukprot:TRINITY_DN39628_c0_g1_i1.p1 TRINITY_DN39628_c0_g1~~TRINITY_DN39628_c0_g1_i1.p1  ORF type:complete len:494 (+),score=63.98 TRINITY_DN39628_c0_g1_i1:214-1695(+)